MQLTNGAYLIRKIKNKRRFKKSHNNINFQCSEQDISNLAVLLLLLARLNMAFVSVGGVETETCIHGQ